MGVAELTYDEVRRATHEATRSIQDIAAVMRSNREDLRRSLQQLENLANRVNTMQSQLTILQQQLHDHSNNMRPFQGSHFNIQAMQNQQNDMVRRMAEMDQLLRSCQQYLGIISRQ